MSNVFDRLKAAMAERAYCYAALELWALVKDAGYSWEQVRGFSFRAEFFTKAQRREKRQPLYGDKKEFGDLWLNCFILHDGTVVEIPLTDRPYDPCKSR